ncbi:hypothetical protein ISN45_At05g024760 [Arabidopsis thaliana x Arabidopsis arenosa]|uniref:Uncharacterized protein n=1 Tax=Arabidopsis thaliana x Arabidopsis arenosa TaxID=1240361 RepID=A0A8T2CT89_9BRAS|nr:hypothetical protein ISN45_At05g024760 [Arabidopsis thaliana x Arabidopsis arenosa]
MDGFSGEELMVTEESEHTWWLSCIFEGFMLEAMCAHSLSVTPFSLTLSTPFHSFGFTNMNQQFSILKCQLIYHYYVDRVILRSPHPHSVSPFFGVSLSREIYILIGLISSAYI